MVARDLIVVASTIGDILKMMPNVNIDDEAIALALSTVTGEQKLGERMVELALITPEQLTEALAIQEKVRTCKSIAELDGFFKSVRDKEREVCFEVGSRLGT